MKYLVNKHHATKSRSALVLFEKDLMLQSHKGWRLHSWQTVEQFSPQGKKTNMVVAVYEMDESDVV